MNLSSPHQGGDVGVFIRADKLSLLIVTARCDIRSWGKNLGNLKGLFTDACKICPSLSI